MKTFISVLKQPSIRMRWNLEVLKNGFANEGLGLNGELPHWESLQPSGLLEGHEGGLVRGQSLADGAGLLWAEVQRNVLLALK